MCSEPGLQALVEGLGDGAQQDDLDRDVEIIEKYRQVDPQLGLGRHRGGQCHARQPGGCQRPEQGSSTYGHIPDGTL